MYLLLGVFVVAQLFLVSTTSDFSFEAKFVRNLSEAQKWKEVIVVHCSNSADVDVFIKWRKVFPSLVYVGVFPGDADPMKALARRIVHANLHILILPTCAPTIDFIVKASKNGLMNKYFTWWILWDPKHLHHSENVRRNTHGLLQLSISNLHLPVNSYLNVVTATQKLQNGHKSVCADVWDVFRMQTGMPAVWRKVESWCETFRTRDIPDVDKPKYKFPSYKEKIRARSAQMKNVPLKVGVIMGKGDYAYDCKVQIGRDGKTRMDEGYSAQILKILQGLLQFTDSYVISSTWGTLENNTWSGLIGLLVAEKADIILCHPTITAERREVVEFLHPTLQSTRVLVYRVASLPLTQDVFVLTFSSSLWLCLFVALLLHILCLSYSTRAYNKPDGEQRAWSWVEVSLWAISVTCQQGYNKEPVGPSCCLVFIVGYISSYLIFTAFAAGVTSLLAVEGQDANLQLGGVAQMNLKLAVYSDGLAQTAIKVANNEAINEPFVSSYLMKEISEERNQISSMNDLMAKLGETNHVSLASQHAVQQFMLSNMSSKEACQLTITPIPKTRNFKAFAVPKNSAFKDVLNYWLLRIHEGGLLRAAAERSMPRKSDCGTGPGYSSAGIGHVMSALMIFGVGVCTSFLLLLGELACSWHQNRRLRQNQCRSDVSKDSRSNNRKWKRSTSIKNSN